MLGVDGKPNLVLVDGSDESFVAVRGKSSGNQGYPLWFPKEVVRRFSEKVFEALLAAHDSGNPENVEKVWNAAPSWVEVSTQS